MRDMGFHGITILFEKHWAHVVTDANLMAYLEAPGNGSMELAAYILDQYHALFHQNLHISQTSLAVEILIHAYLDVFTQKFMEKQDKFPRRMVGPILSLVQKLHRKTEVIDCGERSVDHNRFAFDDLAPFHSLFFALLDKP